MKKKLESFFKWSLGIFVLLIMIVIAALPYLAIWPQSLIGKGLTFLLCLVLLLIEFFVIGLLFVKLKDVK